MLKNENSNNVLHRLVENSEVIIITGKRGGGKTALGYALLEITDNPFVIGLAEEKWHLLPQRITPLIPSSITNLPKNASILIDEAALFLFARDYTSKLNKLIGKLVTAARHNKQLLIFTTHTFRKLDISLVLDTDAILFRKPSFLHSKFERAEVRDIIKKVDAEFKRIEDDHRKYVYVLSHDFNELIEVPLPSFWSNELSTAPISDLVENGGDIEVGMPQTKQKQLIPKQKDTNTLRFVIYTLEGNEVFSTSVNFIAFEWAEKNKAQYGILILYDHIEHKELRRFVDASVSEDVVQNMKSKAGII